MENTQEIRQIRGNDYITENIYFNKKQSMYYRLDTDHLDMVREARREFGRKVPFGPDDVILDLGAHVGGYGCYVANTVKNVVCVEAAPDTYEILKRNAGQYTNVTAIHSACIGDNRPFVDLYLSKKHTGKGSCMASIVHTRGKGSSVQVPTVNFANLLTDYKPTMIKCDTEAAEYEYDWSNLPTHVHSVMLELHLMSKAKTEKARNLVNSLKSQGYEILDEDKLWDLVDAKVNLICNAVRK
jgi:FkbM family methyltransferase